MRGSIFLLLLPSLLSLSQFASSSSSFRQVGRSQVIPSTSNLLRSNLIPEYFRGIILKVNETDLTIILSRIGVGEKCRGDVISFISQLRENYGEIENAENWALKMIDSWSKPPEGLLSGHVSSMGDFDECLSVGVPYDSSLPFVGKYCTNSLIPVTSTNQSSSTKSPSSYFEDPRSIPHLFRLLQILSKSEHPVIPTIASCLPSTCNDSEVDLVNKLVFSFSEGGGAVVPYTGKCYTNVKEPFGAGQIVMLIFLTILVLLCLMGSSYDLMISNGYLRREERPPTKLSLALLCFSVPKNAKKLLNTESGTDSFHCLNGIRFLSASWVVIGHTFYMYLLQPTWNLTELAKAPSTNTILLFIANGGVVVDTFLTMTGILVSYNVLKILEKQGGKVNPLMMYLKRYLRLTPLYAVLIGISATLLPYLGSGPKWYVIETWTAYCKRNWWHNLLFVNNLDIYDPPDVPSDNHQCFGEAWYLAVDMQMYLVSILLLWPLWRWRRFGKVLLGLVTLVSFIIPGVVTYINNLPPTALPFVERGSFTTTSYMAPWMRASPYLIGMWTGYLLYLQKGNNCPLLLRFPLRLRTFIILTIWILLSSAAIGIVLGIRNYFDINYQIPRVDGAVYSSLYHGVWGIFVSWVVYACVNGWGGWINGFLGWKVFIPLGRLTYGIYLISLNLQFILGFGERQVAYYGVYRGFIMGLAHLFVSSFLAFIFALLVELPFAEVMGKVMLPNKVGTRRREIITEEEESKIIIVNEPSSSSNNVSQSSSPLESTTTTVSSSSEGR